MSSINAAGWREPEWYDVDSKELKSLEKMEQVLYAKLPRLTFGPWMISRC